MNTHYRQLEQAGLIEPFEAGQEAILALRDVAQRDITTASELIHIDLDWSLAVAYNAALQAGYALMYARGYRAVGANRHKTVIRFVRATLGPSYRTRLNRLDRIRRKRHQAVYRMAGSVSEGEAKATIEFVEEFVRLLTTLI